jgi:DNA-binding NtrC family response regulator/Tfp pilus assembly protein PilF
MLKQIFDKFISITGDTYDSKKSIKILDEIDLSTKEKQVLGIIKVREFFAKNQLTEAEKFLHEQLDNLVDPEDISVIAFIYKWLYNCKNRLGKYSEALSYAQDYVKLTEESDPTLFTDRYIDLGYAYTCNRKYDLAEKIFLKSIEECEIISNEEMKMRSISMLGELYLRQGLYIEAKENLSRAIIYFRDSNNSNYLNSTLNNYGLVLQNIGQYREAASCFESLINQNEIINLQLGFAHFNLGLCNQKQEEYTKAVKSYEKAFEILEPINNLSYLKSIYNNLALVYENMKKNDLAMEYYQKAYDVSEILNDEFNLRVSRNNIINYKLANNQFFPEMRKEIEENIEYFSEKMKIEHQLKAKKTLSVFYRAKKDYKKAYDIIYNIYEQQGEFYRKQLAEQNQDFYGLIQDTIIRRDRVKNILEPELQKSIKHNLIGESATLRKTIEMARKASSINNTNVLITGESGTGKEIVSRLIHFNSERKNERLVTVNCSAITSTLAESEFFGHIQGAFTGAINNKTGLFEQASGGTLYLDEIGDMPIEIQSKILRAIETGTITPVGGDEEIEVDVRIVASTNKDLDDLILQNKFRLDLLHRINVIHIKIPPLRDREEDLILLIEFFVKQISISMKRNIITFDDSYIKVLKGYTFPGNIRELKNIIERSIILESSNTLTSESLHDINCMRKNTVRYSGSLNLSDVEKEAVFNALSICNNSQKEAAKKLGLSESALSRKLKKYRI